MEDVTVIARFTSVLRLLRGLVGCRGAPVGQCVPVLSAVSFFSDTSSDDDASLIIVEPSQL